MDATPTFDNPDPANLPAVPDGEQTVRDLLGSLRAACVELGAVVATLERTAAAQDQHAERYAAEAVAALNRGDYSAAATACHRAHQCTLQARVLDSVRLAVRP